MPDLMELSELCATVLNEARFPHNRPAYEPPETGPNIPDEIVAFIHELKDTMDDYVKVFIDDLSSVSEDSGKNVISHAAELFEDINQNARQAVELFAGSREEVSVLDGHKKSPRIYKRPDWRYSEEDEETMRRTGIETVGGPSRWYRLKDKTGNFSGPWYNVEYYKGKTDERGATVGDPDEDSEQFWEKIQQLEREGKAETAVFKGQPHDDPIPYKDSEGNIIGNTYKSSTTLPDTRRWRTETNQPWLGRDQLRNPRMKSHPGPWVKEPIVFGKRRGGPDFYWFPTDVEDSSEYDEYVKEVMFAPINRFFPELHKKFFEFYDFLKTEVVSKDKTPTDFPQGDKTKTSDDSKTSDESKESDEPKYHEVLDSLSVNIVDRSIDLQQAVDKAESELPGLGRPELGVPHAPGDPEILSRDADAESDTKGRKTDDDELEELRRQYRIRHRREVKDEADLKNYNLARDGMTDPAEFVTPDDVDPNKVEWNTKYAHVPTENEREASRKAAEKRKKDDEEYIASVNASADKLKAGADRAPSEREKRKNAEWGRYKMQKHNPLPNRPLLGQ